MYRFYRCAFLLGWTILMACADHESLEMCQWLVSKGAEVNAVMAATGWSAMHAASKKGHKEIVELLLKAGGDKHLKAKHREFGQNLEVEDVTLDQGVIHVLEQYQ